PNLSMQDFRVVEASDGHVSFTTEDKHSMRPYPYTYIYNFALCDAAARRDTLPVRACFLPFQRHEHRELNLKDLSVVEIEDELLRYITDTTLKCFKRVHDGGVVTELLAFDPARDYNLKKYLIIAEGGRAKLSFEIDYAE